MEEKVFFKGKFGKICGILNSTTNKNEIVIIIHGFPATKEGGATNLSNILNEIGISSLRIDMDNLGESELDLKTGSSTPNYIKQIDAAISYAKNKGYKEISLLGTSTGGLSALAAAMQHPELKRIFLRAPNLDIEKQLIKRFGKTKLKEFEKQNQLPYINSTGETIWVNFNFYTSAKKYSMYKCATKIRMPIMIIQGDKDEEIDYKIAKEVIHLFPNAQLHIIKGAGHNLRVNGDFSESQQLLKEFFSRKI